MIKRILSRRRPPNQAFTPVVPAGTGTLVAHANWKLISNAEGDTADLLKAQDYVWERSGKRGPRPSSIRPADTTPSPR
jgi:hypothetical protein